MSISLFVKNRLDNKVICLRKIVSIPILSDIYIYFDVLYHTLISNFFYEMLTFQRQTANFIHSASKLRQSKFLPMHALKTTGIVSINLVLTVTYSSNGPGV